MDDLCNEGYLKSGFPLGGYMDVIHNLKQLGLTEGEARVYFSLLKLGSTKIGPIVNDSHISRSKVYDVLERLTAKGLVSHITKGEVRHYNAVGPYRLRDYIAKKEELIRSQREIIDDMIPYLAQVASRNRESSAEIFTGDKGLRSAYEIMYKDAKAGEVLRYFYPYDDYHEVASPFYERLYRFQKSKKLKEKGIGIEAFKKSKYYKSYPKDAKMRFVSFPLPGTMDVFQDMLLIVSWEAMTGILVTSKEISEHFSRYFDSVWEIAT
jgi:HTH-type transcriptional regulator, sugar sensing transcriptional regulator